ncbi:MAG: outer membrane protein assembly factor BamD [Betaproteobacteria bacterium]|nr:outer membrane protein assembly factor BamD [Betaproteobacteria bacterium]MDE2622318.1 outer membrane protein assembly factor BamD [Betaproteobacteria bacterium]
MMNFPMTNISLSRFCLLLLATLLAACETLSQDYDPTKDWSAAKLHSEAKAELQDGNFERAAKLYESLESRYPYGAYSQQAQLEQIYVYYKQHEIASAISEADRFIKAHPNHPGVDYAYYMKGLANFNDDLGLFGIYSPSDLAERDMKPTRESFDAFKELVTRFPNSRYAGDARLRMKYLVDVMAHADLATARYYFRRHAYLAAANRAQQVLKLFPRTSSTEEALYIMAKSYEAMGLHDLQKDSLRVLQRDYPNSRFLASASQAKGSGHPWWRLFW